jgi:putative transcriptional regulator
MKKIPRSSRTFFYVALFFVMLPTLLDFYKGEMGRLIVATTPNADRDFSASVVYIAEHTWKGAMGFVVNQRMKSDDPVIPKYLSGRNLPIYRGGPVEFPDKVFVLEKTEEGAKGNFLQVMPFEKIVAERPDILEQIAQEQKEGSDRYRIYLGYAGWGSSQMEMEFMRGAWFRTELRPEWIFNDSESALDTWMKAIGRAERKGSARMPGII